MAATKPLQVGDNFRIDFAIVERDLIANVSTEIVAPADGYITEMGLSVQKAVTTGGTVTVLTGDAGAVTVAGMTATVANGATKGTRYTANTSPTFSATRKVTKGSRIQVKPTSFATAGELNGYIMFANTDLTPQ